MAEMLCEYHVPIMAKQVVDLLAPERGGVFVDGTLGGGGHSEAILERLPEGARLYGIDRDGDAIANSTARLMRFGAAFAAVRGNFFDMKALLSQYDIYGVDGILLDLGVSSHQLDCPERGFSYRYTAPLDMRMDKDAKLSAYDVVNRYPEAELRRIFFEYGEERFSSRIAQTIARRRAEKPIETTTELAQLVAGAIPAKFRNEPQHPARRCFQAIRIEVNGELDGLKAAVNSAEELLNPAGRLVILTFHSLEDRIVKNCFKTFEQPCTCPKDLPVCVCGKKPTAKILTRHPITADEDEQLNNPRSSPAKLRAIEKL